MIFCLCGPLAWPGLDGVGPWVDERDVEPLPAELAPVVAYLSSRVVIHRILTVHMAAVGIATPRMGHWQYG